MQWLNSAAKMCRIPLADRWLGAVVWGSVVFINRYSQIRIQK